jgi:hypothetical protein
MSHVTAKRPWGTLDVDTSKGVILLREDWECVWRVVGAGVPPSSLVEMHRFQSIVNHEVWGGWNNGEQWSKFALKTKGSSTFAQGFAGKTLTINTDIRWVLRGGHWKVVVNKVPRGIPFTMAHSDVDLEKRRIVLFSIFSEENAASHHSSPWSYYDVSGPPGMHGSPQLNHGDRNVSLVNDSDSIRRVAGAMRQYHMQRVIETLNTMIPETLFYDSREKQTVASPHSLMSKTKLPELQPTKIQQGST